MKVVTFFLLDKLYFLIKLFVVARKLPKKKNVRLTTDHCVKISPSN